MKAGDVVVIDVGGEYSMYATDITRTLPVSGKFSARQREIYDIVLGAQQAAIAAFQPGDRKSTRLNSSHGYISYAVFCLKKKKKTRTWLPPKPNWRRRWPRPSDARRP